MNRQTKSYQGRLARGLKPIRPMLTIEAQEAMVRLKATRTTTQAIVNEAIIYLDLMERENAKHH